MAAPDFPTLYDFDGQMEAAWQAVFIANLAAQVPPVVCQVTTSRENVKLQTPRIELRFATGSALSQRTTQGQANPKQVPNAFDGAMIATIVTARPLEDDNADLHGFLVGLTRFLFSAASKSMTTDNLPYLQILNMLPGSTIKGVFDPKEQDSTELGYPTIFAINNDAWPATA